MRRAHKYEPGWQKLLGTTSKINYNSILEKEVQPNQQHDPNKHPLQTMMAMQL